MRCNDHIKTPSYPVSAFEGVNTGTCCVPRTQWFHNSTVPDEYTFSYLFPNPITTRSLLHAL